MSTADSFRRDRAERLNRGPTSGGGYYLDSHQLDVFVGELLVPLWLTFLLEGLPEDDVQRAATIDVRLARARWPRYRDGWRSYTGAAQPASEADLVIDNNDVRAPTIVNAG